MRKRNYNINMAEIVFFGYGANKDIYRLTEILGKEPEGGDGALLSGFNLATQDLEQIPEKPKNLLEKIWGEKFQAYTLTRGQGFVQGRIWKLSADDLEKIKEWEFVGKGGWRELITVEVVNSDGKKIVALTEKSSDSYQISEIVDGLNYPTNLNKEGKRYYSKEDEGEISLMREEIKKYYGHYINA